MSRPGDRPIVAVDAMGGDHGPSVVIPGAVAAFEQCDDFQLALYGDQQEIRCELERLEIASDAISIVPCRQEIEMSEAPASAIRNKPDSPIVRGMTDQKNGSVQAFVSAGSTGAVVAASLLILGRLEAVDRPAIGTVIPTVDSEFLMLDVGANVQCTPDHLLSFAKMGELFCREVMGIEAPRVGLLNIGGEKSKGNDLTLAAYELLEHSELNFTGNVESNRLFHSAADVVVTDGFTGNVILKLIEGFSRYLRDLTSDTRGEGEAEEITPFRALLEKRFNYEAYGGALLFGIAGISIISHGRSSSRAITNAVLIARRLALRGIPDKLQEALAR